MAERKPVTVIVSTAKVTMPSKAEHKAAGVRGSKPTYNLSVLAVGGSLVVIGRNAKQLNTTINTNNAKEWPVYDDKGKPKTVPVKDADGKVTGTKAVTEKRSFFAIDCNPASDPEKADCRIWRES